MPLDERLFKRLAETPGIPGREEQVRALVRAELAPLVDEIGVDPLGNLIGVRHGRGDVRVMLAAHMDEIGFLVKHIDQRGFLRLQHVGYVDPLTMVAQRVIVTTASGRSLRGALGLDRGWMHPSLGKPLTVPRHAEFYVDLGLPAEEVHATVEIGDFATMDRTFERLGEHFLSKAIDDRVGLFVLIEALRALPACEATIYAVATTQEEVGLRGATVGGYALDPTVAIALDDAPAMDVPGGGGADTVLALGAGVGIKLMDASSIAHPGLVRHLRALADDAGIPYQLEILPFGGTDAGAIQRARGGVPATTLSIPARYVHTVNEMVNVRDVQAAIDLLVLFLKGAHETTFAR